MTTKATNNTPDLEPPSLSVGAKLVSVAVLLGALALVVVLWACISDPPLVAAAIGDATAPLVGVITAVALGATAWSVHLQRHAIKVQLQELQAQRAELVASRTTMEEQTKAQTELAELQRKVLRDAELRELRSAYANWFAEVQTWLTAMFGYGVQLEASGDALTAEVPDEDGLRRLRSAVWQVVLLDTSARRVLRVKTLSQPIGLGRKNRRRRSSTRTSANGLST